MHTEQDTARLNLINQVLDATTLEEIARAEDALEYWMQAHPDDSGMVDGFEQLSIMKDAAQTIEAEAVAGHRRPAQAA